MEECLIVHPRAYNKAIVIYSLAFITNLVSLILMTINYCRSVYSLDLLEENDPDIDLTGIKKFSFSAGSIQEYKPSLPNLGDTGRLFLNCYTGKCTYVEYYTCYYEECYGEGEEEECYEYEDTCERYDTETEYACSNYCRKTKSASCGSSYCGGYKRYYYSSSKCSNDDDSKDYDRPKSCNADNIIYNWNYLYYDRTNATTYGLHTYLNSAVQANENCPTGKKMCGILDDLGNKLCYNIGEDCPINVITSNNNESISYKFEEVDGLKVYYTYEAIETGRVLGGFFVDSDLLIKYNKEDCVTLKISTISSLLNSQSNKLYRKSLDYDPYKEKDINQKGNSYLKWCIPGHGKEKNITLIKELKVVYDYNKTANKEVIQPIKTKFTASYFVALPGYIGVFLFLIILICSFCSQNNINSSCELGFIQWDEKKNLLIFIPLFISLVLIFSGAVTSITNNSNLSDANKLEQETSLFSSLILMNIICFSVNMFLLIIIIGFLIYLYCTPTTAVEYDKPDNSYTKHDNDKTTKNTDLNVYNNNPDFNSYNTSPVSKDNNTNSPDFNAYNSSNPDFNAYNNNNNQNFNAYNSSNPDYNAYNSNNPNFNAYNNNAGSNQPLVSGYSSQNPSGVY